MAIINQAGAVAPSGVKLIDARGPRFGAAITTFGLALALVTHSVVVIAFQLVVLQSVHSADPQRPHMLLPTRSL